MPVIVPPAWEDRQVSSGPAATHPPGVRTFKRRSGRVTPGQTDARQRLWPQLGLAVDGRRLDLPALFGRVAPLVVDVGFGMGEATAEMAAAQPDHDVLAVDVHTPGQGNLLRLVERRRLTNVRVADGDARVLLAEMLPAASVAVVRVFFPDPWPKTRHAKRRLVTPAFAALVADRLVDGGTVHLATDMAAYALEARDVLATTPGLTLAEPPWRATTRFERRGGRQGRPAHDLAARRAERTPPQPPTVGDSA
jgi:tRNA (guanine-N7-)-methyltransferase